MLRKAVIVLAMIYALLGVGSAYMFTQAIPAINWKGAVYIAVTWPAWINGSPVRLPIPDWTFSFED